MSDASEMIFRTIKCFSNDGKLDVNELDQIVKIARADGVVDEQHPSFQLRLKCSYIYKPKCNK